MTKIIGHRGARGLAAENTIASLQRALESGVDEIECDVRVTGDGIPILVHNKTLRATDGTTLAISKHTLHELQAAKADLPTLAEVIRFVDKRVPLLLEVKRRVATKEIAAVIRGFLKKGWKEHDFLLGSFSQRTLRQLHAELPDIEKVIIERLFGAQAIHRAKQVNATRMNMWQHNLWWGFIRSMSRSGWKVSAYTLNDPKKAARWTRHGLDGIITDYPDRFGNERKK